MSQRDLVAELRGARIAAPAELRERVRAIAAADTTAAPAASPGAARSSSRCRSPPRSPRASSSRGRATTTRLRRRLRPRRRPARRSSQAQVHGAKSLGRSPASRTGCRGGAAKLAPPRTPGRVQTLRRVPRAARADARRRLRRRQARAAHRVVARRLPHLGARDLAGQGRERRPVAEDPARARPGGDHPPLRARHDHGEQVDVQDLQAGLNADRPHDRAAAEAARRPPRADTDATTSGATIAALTAQIVRLQRAAGGDASARRTTRRSSCTCETPEGSRRRRSTATARCTGSASRSAGSGSARSTRSRSGLRSLLLVAARLARGAVDPPAARGRAAQSALSCANTRNVGSPTGSSWNSGLTQPRSSVARLVGRARSRPCTSAAGGASRGSRRSRACAPRPRGACRGRSRRRRPSACSRRTCAPTPRTSRRTGSRARGRRRGRRPCRSGPRSGGTPSRPGDEAAAPVRRSARVSCGALSERLRTPARLDFRPLRALVAGPRSGRPSA